MKKPEQRPGPRATTCAEVSVDDACSCSHTSDNGMAWPRDLPLDGGGKLAFVSASIHGCPNNNSYSQKVRDYLVANGWGLTTRLEDADLIVYSGCGVVEIFERLSLMEVRHTVEAAAKRKDKDVPVVVTGCLPDISRRTGTRLFGESLDEMNCIPCGPGEMENLDRAIQAEVPFESVPQPGEYPRKHLMVSLRQLIDSIGDRRIKARLIAYAGLRHLASFPGRRRDRTLLLAGHGLDLVYYHGFNAVVPGKGCMNACSYCVIKFAKGRAVSTPRADVVAQCKKLLDAGQKKIVLWPDDLGSWGIDLGDNWTNLVRDIVALGEGLQLAIYNLGAHEFIEHGAFLEELATQGHVCYLAVMLQHTTPRILERMNRKPVDMAAFNELWQRLGQKGVMLETHFIVGFPGETEQEYEELVRFVRDSKNDYFGLLVNPYFPVKGTLAASRFASEELPRRTIDRRAKRLQRLYTAKVARSWPDLFRIRLKNYLMAKLFTTATDYTQRGHISMS